MARTFDGSNDYLRNSSFTVAASRSKFTLSAFMKRSSSGKAMFGCWDSSTNNLQHGFAVLLWSDGNAYVMYGNGDSSQYASVANTTYDTFVHVFVHFDGGLTGDSNRLKLWIDGVQQTLTFNQNTNTSTSANLSSIWAGARPNGPEYGASSVTRLAAWYGVDMGETEADAIAGGTAPSSYSSGLIDYWPCTTTSGDEVGTTYTLTDNGGVGYEADPSFGGGGVEGSLTATLAALSSSAAGTVDVQGALSSTLAALTSSAAGTVAVAGAAAATLGALSSSAAGTVALAGASSVTLAALTSSAAGAVEVQGSASATLAALSLSAEGAISSGISGELASTLGAATSSAAGTVAVAGAAAPTLGALTSSGAGTIAVTGALSATLGELAISAAGAVTDGPTAELAATLGALTASAAGTVAVSGASSATLAALTATAIGSVEILGALGTTLGSLSISAAGVILDTAPPDVRNTLDASVGFGQTLSRGIGFGSTVNRTVRF